MQGVFQFSMCPVPVLRRLWEVIGPLLTPNRYYFKKSESLQVGTPAQEQEFKTHHTASDHGAAGPVQTTYQPFFAETHKYWHSTMHNMNVETNSSHFGGSNVGAWTTVTSVDPKTQTRSYSASAYLTPFAHLQNLIVLTEVHTQEIIFRNRHKSADLVATGVRFTNPEGLEFTARCTKEVIVCGGAVGSPQLLELSGIGNADILRSAGVTPKLDNASVGENLQEHMSKDSIPHSPSPWQVPMKILLTRLPQQ